MVIADYHDDLFFPPLIPLGSTASAAAAGVIKGYRATLGTV